jgi:hypothetical protein
MMANSEIPGIRVQVSDTGRIRQKNIGHKFRVRTTLKSTYLILKKSLTVSSKILAAYLQVSPFITFK